MIRSNELSRLCVVGVVAGAVGVAVASLLGQGAQPQKPTGDSELDAALAVPLDDKAAPTLEDRIEAARQRAATNTQSQEKPSDDLIKKMMELDREDADQYPVVIAGAGNQWLCVTSSGNTYLIDEYGLAKEVRYKDNPYGGEIDQFNARFWFQRWLREYISDFKRPEDTTPHK